MFSLDKMFTDLSNADYHSFGEEVVSSSFLKNVYKHSILKAREPIKNHAALKFGTAFHDMMELGKEKFDKYYSIAPDVDKRTKEYKQWVADLKGKSFVTSEEYDVLTQMLENVNQNEVINYWRDSFTSHEEYSFFGDYDGTRCRIRPDIFFTDNGKINLESTDKIKVIADWKTCQDVTEFKWDIKKYNYDLQAVFYSDFLGIDPRYFYFVAVEKNYPYSCQVYALSDRSIEEGRRKMGIAFNKIANGDTGTGLDLIQII